jgi:hypothetical protein
MKTDAMKSETTILLQRASGHVQQAREILWMVGEKCPTFHAADTISETIDALDCIERDIDTITPREEGR